MRWGDIAYENAVKNPEIKIMNEPVKIPTPAFLTTGQAANTLAGKFETMWQELEGPPLLREYKFHPDRKWRADYCHKDSRVLIELEGGVWDGGRHTRGPGFINDIEKYNAATMLGYRVLRIPTGGVKRDVVQRMIEFIHSL